MLTTCRSNQKESPLVPGFKLMGIVNGQWWRTGGIIRQPLSIKKKDYHKPGYWKDWYWNKGGREKVQEKRYIAEYEREKKKVGVLA